MTESYPLKNNIKILIWIYFWLLILEGSLRKWLFPQLSGPLLIIRDPVVLGIYMLAIRANLFPKHKWMQAILFLGFVMTMGALLVIILSGSGDIRVVLFGLRTNFLFLPLIFVLPQVLTAADLKRFGYWLLLISLPMAILMAVQFNAAPTDWINRGTGLEESLQITSAMGRIRPPGTFSYIAGPAALFPFITAFFIEGLLKDKIYPLWLLICGGAGIILACAVSGSRSTLLAVVLVVLAMLVAYLIRPSFFVKAPKILFVVVVALAIMTTVPVFSDGLEVFQTRWDGAARAEASGGGIVGRFGRGFLGPLQNVDIPLLGYGLGMGTNVGSVLLTGELQFLLAEGEWSRVVLESGFILGMLYLLLRCALVLWMGALSVQQVQQGNILPLLLFAASALLVLNGQLGQVTILGFAVFGAGLCLAACQSQPSTDVA